MEISQRFGHTGKVTYQYGHARYHYRCINGTVYRFGRFVDWNDGSVSISRERVTP